MIIFDLHVYGGCERSKTVSAHFGTLFQCLIHPTVPHLKFYNKIDQRS